MSAGVFLYYEELVAWSHFLCDGYGDSPSFLGLADGLEVVAYLVTCEAQGSCRGACYEYVVADGELVCLDLELCHSYLREVFYGLGAVDFLLCGLGAV